MNSIFGRLLIFGILLFSLMQENETPQPIIEAYLDLIQSENQIIVAGSVISDRNMSGLRLSLNILGDDRRFVYNLLYSPLNLQANNPVTLKGLNNGSDITFSLEYLYGEYIVSMKVSGGSPSVNMTMIMQ
jgi:hypothetical protein